MKRFKTKKNERNAGRKPDGDEAKLQKSICLEHKYINVIKKDFPNFSKGIEELIKDYIKNKAA
jgi:hypothetical protein